MSSGDYTRVTFNPREDHIGVLMQQGRVLLDADFNELVEILERRIRAGTLDTIGACAVPRETIDGFLIQIAGTTVTIGRGRIYVDGVLAENHGKPPLEYDLDFDPVTGKRHGHLGELRGTQDLGYEEQPYLPKRGAVRAPDEFPLPAGGGPHLLYVDVWQREITYLEEPDLIEKAVGVDTATRLQTAWQVKALAAVGQVTCATPDDQIPGWIDLTRPSASRLTTAAVGVPASDDPCIVNPAGGFRGTENRLYRVEVHEGGTLGTATFKWSRDNGSIASAVTGLNAGLDELTVSRTGRDAVLRFNPQDWVEVLDDWHELLRKPGVLRKVSSVDDAAQKLVLAAPLPPGEFDTANLAGRHTRVRRWDQKGLVLDAANNVVADVDALGGDIPTTGGVNFVLEDGVQVTFSLAPTGGVFRTGDYWVFAARTVDASVEILSEAPPRGPVHHYCRLALVTFPSGVVDCRPIWPPDVGDRGCDCTACVSAESHNNGSFTIQMAIAQVQATGGKVCLGPGVFNLGITPVLIQGARSLAVHGHGVGTILLYLGDGPAVRVTQSTGVEIQSLTIFGLAVRELASAALLVQNSSLVRVERCLLAQFGRARRGGPAVALAGFLVEIVLRDNLVFGTTGIQTLAATLDGKTHGLAEGRRYALTFGLYLEDNFILALAKGISLEGVTLHVGETRIAGNSVYGCQQAGVVAQGLVYPLLTSSRLELAGNELLAFAAGMIVGTDNARISGNDIGVLRLRRGEGLGPGGAGIQLKEGVLPDGPARCQVLANRVTGIAGDGIRVSANVDSAMIKDNILDQVRGNGVVMDEESRAGVLNVENNQILRSSTANARTVPVAAIRLVRVRQAVVSSNMIEAFALGALQNPLRAGIQVLASESVQISDNVLIGIGPPAEFVNRGAGIDVLGPFDRVDVVDNLVRRSGEPPTDAGASRWNAVVIREGGGDAGIRVFPVVREGLAHRYVFLLADLLVVLPRQREVVAVRGNLLEAYGTAPAVDVRVVGDCTFSDNRCFQAPPREAGGVLVAQIGAGAAIVGGNYLRRPPGTGTAPALRLVVPSETVTVLGNISSGPTFLNTNALGPPWAPLNIVAP